MQLSAPLQLPQHLMKHNAPSFHIISHLFTTLASARQDYTGQSLEVENPTCGLLGTLPPRGAGPCSGISSDAQAAKT